MPGSVVDPVMGDPVAVASAARAMTSIATEVARQASRLRGLATSTSDWTGQAAVGARARSATLPPKLDKVTASYGSAGQALSSYAGALAEAQQRSRTAIAAAERAEADLRAALQAQANAAGADTQNAAAAAAAGLPAPPPSAPRYQSAIDEATADVRRATAANQAAHDQQHHAATRAAAALKAASRQGIPNQSWWRHVTHGLAHWAATQWRAALAQLAAAAGEISLLTSIAAAVLAIGGLFFPPLEAAAALAETISMTTGLVASVSTTVVDLSDKRTRDAGFINIALLAAPTAARKLTRFIPAGDVSGVLNITSDADRTATSATRSIPLGFENENEFKRFAGAVHDELDRAGHAGTVPIMHGSSVTGVSYETGVPFDEGRVSDYDVALCGDEIFTAVSEAGIETWGSGTRSMPLDHRAEDELRSLNLFDARARLSGQVGRDVNFMIYPTVDSALARAESIRFPK